MRQLNEKEFMSRDRAKRFFIGSKKEEERKVVKNVEVLDILQRSDWIRVAGFSGVCRAVVFKDLSVKAVGKSYIGKLVTLNEASKEKVGMILDYFGIGTEGNLTRVKCFDDNFYLSIRAYISHVPDPIFINNSYMYSAAQLESLSNSNISIPCEGQFADNFGIFSKKTVERKEPEKSAAVDDLKKPPKRSSKKRKNSEEDDYSPHTSIDLTKEGESQSTRPKRTRRPTEKQKQLEEDNK